MSKTLDTTIILKGMTDPSLSKAFKNAQKMADYDLDRLKGYGETAKKAFAVAGTAAIGAGVVSTKAAIDYESAFAGVMKTVDETSTTTYDDLSKGIRNMAKELPASANEIASVAENAGQLGIKADDILKFSKTVIDLGESTNLSSEDAATAIAKLFNITGQSMDNVDKFGATLVALGNNAATTESDIMNMASRIAGTGNQVGLSEKNILALATTISSVGINAELGGSSISKVMTMIDTSVATNKKSLSDWAKTAGMSVKSFKKSWQTDAYGTLIKVVQGMSKVKSSGGNLNVLLEQLGIKGIGTSDTMKRLAGATDLMVDMNNLANKSWSEGTALSEEAQKRYATMASKLAMLRNKFTDVAISVGNVLMPYLEKFVDWLSNVDFDKVAKSIESVINTIKKLAPFIAVLGAMFVGLKIGQFITTIIGAAKIIFSLVKSFGALQVVMSLAGGPIALIVAGIAGLIAIFVLLWNKCEGFRNFWKGLWSGIKKFAKTAVDAIVKFFTETIPNGINSMISWFQNLPSRIWTWLKNTASKIGEFAVNVWNKAKEIGSNFVNGVINFFATLPERLGFILGYAIGKIIQWGMNIWNFITVKIPQIISAIVSFFAQLPSRIWTWLVNTIQKIISWGASMIALGRQKASQFITSVVSFIKTLPARIWTWLKNAASKVVSWGAQLAAKGKAAARKLLNAVVNGVKAIPGKMLSIGKNIVEGLWNGINGMVSWVIGKVKSFGSSILKGIKSALGINSPSTVFRDQVGRFIAEGVGVGIVRNTKTAVNAVKSLGGKVVDTASRINPTIQTKVSSIADKAKTFLTGETIANAQSSVDESTKSVAKSGSSNRGGILDRTINTIKTGTGKVINITFAPVINGGNAEENRQMIKEEEQSFKDKMEEYFSEKERLEF